MSLVSGRICPTHGDTVTEILSPVKRIDVATAALLADFMHKIHAAGEWRDLFYTKVVAERRIVHCIIARSR